MAGDQEVGKPEWGLRNGRRTKRTSDRTKDRRFIALQSSPK